MTLEQPEEGKPHSSTHAPPTNRLHRIRRAGWGKPADEGDQAGGPDGLVELDGEETELPCESRHWMSLINSCSIVEKDTLSGS
jgi:hypothetical protein